MKKIIACLDTRDGRVVKGVQFTSIRDIGDPAELAAEYEKQGIDELVVLDITASLEGCGTLLETVRRVAAAIHIPLTVGGGVRSVCDAEALISAGADKISIGSAGIQTPALYRHAATALGRERVVAAIDARWHPNGMYVVVTGGGKVDTPLDAIAFAKQAEELGVGEILLTSKDADGMKDGYDLPLTDAVSGAVRIPVIASGGCGTLSHFYDVFTKTGAAAALAASLFHERIATVPEVRQYLHGQGIAVKTRPYDRYFIKNEIIPAIVVEEGSGEVLMLAYMSRESLIKTIKTGTTWFYSRSRKSLWHKGETSGHFQQVLGIKADCDEDTFLITVRQQGNACHTGAKSCFFRTIES